MRGEIEMVGVERCGHHDANTFPDILVLDISRRATIGVVWISNCSERCPYERVGVGQLD